MFGDTPRDGDLPPGVYERLPNGTLVPTNKMLTDDPPRPLPKHVNAKGQITDIAKKHMENLYDSVVGHYELKRQKALTSSRGVLAGFRELVDRAAEAVIRSHL